MDKKAFRRAMGARKAALSESEIARRSARLAEKLFATEAYRRADALFAYISFNREVHTAPIIRRAWSDGKRVAVPKVVGDGIRFIRIDRLDDLAPGAFGIPEPVADEPIMEDETALVLVPGLAFDAEGRRVGYGGGYYDRYLARHAHHPTVALCYDFQFVDRLEAEAHDIPVGLVLTDA